MKNYAELELHVIRWAEARKIIPNSTSLAQTRKTHEEAGEMLEAAAAMRAFVELIREAPELESHPVVERLAAKALAEFKDAVGDTVVTIINACALADVTVVDCLNGSYQEIKDRRGTLMPNGVFVKE